MGFLRKSNKKYQRCDPNTSVEHGKEYYIIKNFFLNISLGSCK